MTRTGSLCSLDHLCNSRFTNNGETPKVAIVLPYWKEFVNASPEESLKARLDTKWEPLFPEMQALPNCSKKMSSVRNHVHIIHKHKYTDTERKKQPF